MGAISKFGQIFSKLGRHHSRLNTVRYDKFRANQKIHRDFGAPSHEIGRNYIWELYLNLDRFSRKLADINLGLVQYVVPNFVQIEGYIGALVHHLH